MSNALTMQELLGPYDGSFQVFDVAMIYGRDGHNSPVISLPGHLATMHAVIRYFDDHPDITNFRRLLRGDKLWIRDYCGKVNNFSLLGEYLWNA